MPAMIGLVSLASSLALFGFALRAIGHEGEKIAQRYGPGVVVVVVALFMASAIVVWTRRTLGSVADRDGVGHVGAAPCTSWLVGPVVCCGSR